MKKSLLLLIVSVLWLCGYAQTGKKIRHTVSNSQTAVTERAISSRFNQGLRYYYTAQFEDALQSFSGILLDAPRHAPSYFMLFRVYKGRQQFAEAENALKQAVKFDKDNIWYQVELARTYVADGDYKSATPMWEKICREIPDNAEFLTVLSTCYTKTGAPEKASEIQSRLDVQAGQGAVDEQFDSADASGESAGFKAQGLAAVEAMQYGRAAAFFESALREDDTDYDLWTLLAESVAKSGQWRMLTSKEEDLTTLFPQSSALLSALAEAFLHTGQPEKALEYYKQAQAFAFEADQIQVVRSGLYNAYTQLGDTENALRYK